MSFFLVLSFLKLEVKETKFLDARSGVNGFTVFVSFTFYIYYSAILGRKQILGAGSVSFNVDRRISGDTYTPTYKCAQPAQHVRFS